LGINLPIKGLNEFQVSTIIKWGCVCLDEDTNSKNQHSKQISLILSDFLSA